MLRHSLLFTLSFLFLFTGQAFCQEKVNAIPVQKQLDAYNARDIDAFLAPYSDSIKVYNHPNRLIMSGKDEMRQRYASMFDSTPDLHCTLINRMVLGNIVIDQEYVITVKNGPAIQLMAMYKIKEGKIEEVYFIRPDEQ